MPSQFSATTRSLANDGFRYASVTWLAAMLLLLAWLCWFCMSEVAVSVTSTKARLERAPHALAAAVAGKVVRARVAIGQQVKAGDVLVELDAKSEKLRLREERSRFAAMAPRIKSMKKELAALEGASVNEGAAAAAAGQAARYRSSEAAAAVAFAEENARRMTAESKSGSIAQIDAMRAESEAARLQASGSALSQDGRRLELEGLSRLRHGQAQTESLRRNVAATEADRRTTALSIERLQADTERHTIRSPVDGRIGDVVALRPGSYASAGQHLVTVVPSDGLVIVADFPPAAVLGRVHAGQSARLRLTGFPWTQYGSIDATVTRVATEVRDNLVRVELAPKDAASTRRLMQHALPGNVDIVIERVAPAVLMLRASGQLLSPSVASSSAGEAASE